MPLSLYWFLPTHGDGQELSRRAGSSGQRDPDRGYLGQVAAAAEQLGFAGALVPAGMFCEDPWLVSIALAQQTSRLEFMVAMRPGLVSPMLAGQMAATAQRLTGNRLLLNVVTGGDPDEQGRYGSWLDHTQRYAQATEFLTIMTGAWSGQPLDYHGGHYRVRGAVVRRPAAVAPPIFVGGSSSQAQQLAAQLGDVYLAWGETPGQLAELFAAAGRGARQLGRNLAFGTRFHVISRDTPEAAWEVADQLVSGLDPDMVRAAQARYARSESVGQRRAAALHRGRGGQLEIYPNIWAGYGLLRPGTAVALVGSHDQVADRIAELHHLGVSHLILSGQPHLEEAYRFGEGVVPLLRARGVLGEPGPDGRAGHAVPAAVSAHSGGGGAR
jgi:alkanesulfonate monooxygenase